MGYSRSVSYEGERLRCKGERATGRISGIAHDLENALRKMFVDLSVAGNWLRNLGNRIVIPIVFPAMAHKHTTAGFEL